MIKFKGTTIFPPAIFDVLDMVREVELYQIEVARDEFGNDLVSVVLPEHLNTDAFNEKLHSLFRSKLRVTPHHKFVPVAELNSRIFKQEKRKPEKLVYL